MMSIALPTLPDSGIVLPLVLCMVAGIILGWKGPRQ